MAQVQGSNLLDVLKKKMRLTKEEMEKYKEESEDMGRKLQVEIMRREEVYYTRIKNKWKNVELSLLLCIPTGARRYGAGSLPATHTHTHTHAHFQTVSPLYFFQRNV